MNLARVNWGQIEPHAPADGRHAYDWSSLDEGVRQWQQYGVHLMMSLRFACTATPLRDARVLPMTTLQPYPTPSQCLDCIRITRSPQDKDFEAVNRWSRPGKQRWRSSAAWWAWTPAQTRSVPRSTRTKSARRSR